MLKHLETGRPLGFALVCAEARYATVSWSGAARFDRRFATASEWLSAMHELQHFEPAPLAANSVLASLLVPGRTRTVTVQYLYALPIEAEPSKVVDALDALLKASAVMRKSGEEPWRRERQRRRLPMWR